jgi:hypothetical protein
MCQAHSDEGPDGARYAAPRIMKSMLRIERGRTPSRFADGNVVQRREDRRDLRFWRRCLRYVLPAGGSMYEDLR